MSTKTAATSSSSSRRLGLLPMLVWLAIAVGSHGFDTLRSSPFELEGHEHRLDLDNDCTVRFRWIKPPRSLAMALGDHKLSCRELDNSLRLVNMTLLNKLVSDERFLVQQMNKSRFFFVQESLGDSAVAVLFTNATGFSLKLLTRKSDSAMVPQDVLCAQETCKSQLQAIKEAQLEQERSDQILQENRNASFLLQEQRMQFEMINRDLTMQVVIYQVVCALTGFMTVTLGFSALALCIRLKRRGISHKRSTKRNHNALGNTNNHLYTDNSLSPTYYGMSGKIEMAPPSPYISSDPMMGGLAFAGGDTASINNVMMTNSSLSACDGQTGQGGMANATYVTYPMSSLSACNYASAADQSMITLMPLINRQTMNGGTTSRASYLYHCPSSPTANMTTQIENKLNQSSRNGSLTRPGYQRRVNMSLARSPCGTPQFCQQLTNTSPSPVLMASQAPGPLLNYATPMHLEPKVKHSFPSHNNNHNSSAVSTQNGNGARDPNNSNVSVEHLNGLANGGQNGVA